MPEPRRIAVTDDDPDTRYTLGALLTLAGYAPVEFADGADLLAALASPNPRLDCAIVDVQMPGLGAEEVLEHLSRRGGVVPVIVLTGHASVQLAVRCMKLRAVDILEKPFDDVQLLEAIRLALERSARTVVPAGVLESARARYAALTPRQREVMSWVVRGAANKVIAAELNISIKTVEIHRGRVMETMAVDSLAELVRTAAMLEQEGADPAAGA